MRRSHRIVGAVAASVATSVAAVTVVSNSAGAATTAKSEYQAALKAAGSQNVHYISKANEPGIGAIKAIGDTGKTSGSLDLQIVNGSKTEHLKVLLVGSTGYVRGNEVGLEAVLGLTAAQSTTYANKWLSFPTSNTSLAELVSGLRDTDIPSELQMSGPYTFGSSKTINGQDAKAINGTAATSSGKKVRIILYVSDIGVAASRRGDHQSYGEVVFNQRFGDILELG